MRRAEFKVPRPCGVCHGSGKGNCLVTCFHCDGKGVRRFTLYSTDLEGVTLVTYVRPSLDPNDPSMRVAPKRIEDMRRPFLTADAAHEYAAMMLAHDEIVSYAVIGFDDFAKLSEEDVAEAIGELDMLAERARVIDDTLRPVPKTAEIADVLTKLAMKNKDGEEMKSLADLGTREWAWDKFLIKDRAMRRPDPELWEEPDTVAADLTRIGQLQINPVTGCRELTPKGQARLIAMLTKDEEESAWTRQMNGMMRKAVFLADKAAE